MGKLNLKNRKRGYTIASGNAKIKNHLLYSRSWSENDLAPKDIKKAHPLAGQALKRASNSKPSFSF